MERDKKWNLQDIKPAEPRKRRTRPVMIEREEATAKTQSRPSAPRRAKDSNKKKGKTTLFILGGLVLLLVASFAIGALFGGAKVTVYPRYRDPVINTALEAKREAAGGELAYEVLTLEAEGERQVTATGQETITETATGEIVISNSSSKSEKLVKNTRFETADGIVFHIEEATEVPAASDGQPGTVVASVYADEAGPEYNVSAGTPLTVPGFEESNLMDLFAAITGEVASDITNGYDGPRYMINDGELATAQESLHTELEEALIERLPSEIPAGFTIFDNAVTFDYTTLPSEAVSEGDGQVMIKEKASLKVPIFKDAEFASYIASVVVPGYDGEPVRIEDTSTLEFSYLTDAATGTPTSLAESISFKLVGKPRLVWTFDEEKLRQDLSGALQVSLNTILGGYPAIEKATTSIQPFWRRSFPEDPEKIEVIEVVGDN